MWSPFFIFENPNENIFLYWRAQWRLLPTNAWKTRTYVFGINVRLFSAADLITMFDPSSINIRNSPAKLSRFLDTCSLGRNFVWFVWPRSVRFFKSLNYSNHSPVKPKWYEILLSANTNKPVYVRNICKHATESAFYICTYIFIVVWQSHSASQKTYYYFITLPGSITVAGWIANGNAMLHVIISE